MRVTLAIFGPERRCWICWSYSEQGWSTTIRTKPSRDDIEMIREVKGAAEALGIAIQDHLVIGRKGHASFRVWG